jgi:hypothetical protein
MGWTCQLTGATVGQLDASGGFDLVMEQFQQRLKSLPAGSRKVFRLGELLGSLIFIPAESR